MKSTLEVCALFAFLSPAVIAAGCGPDEEVNPAPTGTAPTTTMTGGSGGSGGSGGAPPEPKILRTVEQRSPFGNVAATGNLLWDGDFEWSSPFSDQYGWLYGPPYGYAFPAATIGAACLSGVKCVTLPKNRGIVGIGVGSQKDLLSISVFAKPMNGDCEGVDVALIDPFAASADVPVPLSDGPDSKGWCRFETVTSHPTKVYLLVDNGTTDEVIVDDAVVASAPQDKALAPPGPSRSAPSRSAAAQSPPTAEVASRRELVREVVRRPRHPVVPPQDPARRAFEEHFSR